MQPLTLAKSGILYLNKGNSVIHTTPGIQVQVVEQFTIKAFPHMIEKKKPFRMDMETNHAD